MIEAIKKRRMQEKPQAFVLVYDAFFVRIENKFPQEIDFPNGTAIQSRFHSTHGGTND